MNKILFAVAALATFGTVAAHADDRVPFQNAPSAQAVIVEGRNAATAVPAAVASDAYIARSVAQDAHSK